MVTGKVRANAYQGWVMVHVCNGTRNPSDLRSEAPRWEYITPREAMRLIAQLVSAILRARAWRARAARTAKEEGA